MRKCHQSLETQPVHLVNNMKNLRDIIVGVIIGIAVFAGIVSYENFEAEKNFEAKAAAIGTNGFATELLADLGIAKLDYDDVFGAATYKNMYLMMWLEVVDKPNETAVRDLAQQYGITLAQAEAAKTGATAAIINSPKFVSQDLTNQELMDISNQVISDFNDKLEILTLKQELSIASANSEIFSNGDVTDSGFDLVHDLDVIEKLLFNTVSDTSLGNPLTWGQNTKPEPGSAPYSQTPSIEPNVPDAYQGVIKTLTEDDAAGGGAGGGNDAELDRESLGETNPLKKLDEDVCPEEESNLDKAIADYDEAADAYKAEQIAHGQNPDGEDAPDNSDGSGEADKKDVVPGVAGLTPAKPDDWNMPLECNGVLWEGGSDMSDPDAAKVSAMYYICLEWKIKWQKYTSYVPVDNCIACEFEKINSYLQETLSHSLVPNKATGNFGETAKCKDTLNVPLIDLRFVTMWAPAQTPPHDEAIYGKSVATEWEKFLKRTHPFGLSFSGTTRLPEYNQELASKLAYSYMSPDTSFSELQASINQIQNEVSKQQAESVEQFSIESEGQDFVGYSQEVLAEVKQITMYFRNFTRMLKTLVDETCPALLSKDYLD